MFVLVAKNQFGVSTHLYHGQRLSRDHLLEIAAHGFSVVEVFATRTHFDYHNLAAVADLQQWLAEAGLELQSIHAPVAEAYEGGRSRGPLSIASADAAERERAVTEAEHALHIARRIPVKRLITHLGLARTQPQAAADSRAAARRSVEELAEAASPLGVQVVVEVIPNELSRAGSLVHFVEEDVAATSVGICLDFGHAHMDGDLVDAIETVSEHLAATHIHDNRGRTDDHLVPFDGTIDWAAALTTVQKIGFDGTLLLEVAAHGSPRETLRKARAARQKLEALLAS
jgi:sugar phosphate isomerase/epimerase